MATSNQKPVVISHAQLDSSFSGDGLASVASGLGDDRARSIAVLSGGDYIVVGSSGSGSNSDFSLLKLKSNGAADASFSTDGWQTTNISGNDQATAVATIPGGGFVVVGTANIGSSSDVAVVRYHDDGSLDNSFSGDGIVTTSLSVGADKATAVAVQGDGKLLVLATRDSDSSSAALTLLRYTATGELDSAFGSNGIASINFNYFETIGDMCLMADGRIVVAGYVWTGSQYDVIVARFNSNGSLDSSFNGDGLLQLDLGKEVEQLQAVAVQADGKIVLAGKAGSAADTDDLLVRLTEAGVLDSTFGGGDGTVLLNNGAADVFNDVVIQADGKIVATGFQDSGYGEVSLARFNADGTLDTSFNNGSGVFSTLFANGTSRGYALAVDDNGQILVAGDSWANSYQFGVLRLDDDLADQSATAQSPFAYTVPASAFYDADGDPLSYTAALADGSALPAWLQFDPATLTFSGTPDVGDFGTLQVAVTASDGQASATAGFQLEVTSGFLEALRNADHFRWNSAEPNGTPGTVLTFSFMETPSANASGLEVSSFSAMTASQRQAVRDVLQQYSEIAGISFTEVAAGSGILQCGNYQEVSSTAAYAKNGGSYAELWVNRHGIGYDQPTIGSWNYETLLHEIGHVLGFKHPGNYYAGSDGPFLPTEQDNNQYTVMSYNQRADDFYLDVVPAGNSYDFNYSTIACATPMLYDIAAAQFLYGANAATRAGDDIYSFDPATPFFKTLWDGGGIDTISLANFAVGGLIDLQAGHYSNIPVLSDAIPNGYIATAPSYQGNANLAIAYGAVFEKAVGGNGNDTLIGNADANWLQGGQGKDTLTGGLGGDVFICQAGDSLSTGCDVITDFDANDKIQWAGISGINFGLASFVGSIADTVAAIRNDQALSDKAVFFADASDGYLYVNGAGTGISFDDTLLELAGKLIQPDIQQLVGLGNPNNHAPTLSNPDGLPGDQRLMVGSALDLSFAADTFGDVDAGDSLYYSASLANGSPLPGWLSFSGGSRSFSGTPTVADTGKFTLRLTASDDIGASVSSEFQLVIKNPVYAANLNPVIKDVLLGADGVVDDLIDGGRGADTMKGGAGDDVYIVDDKGDKVSELSNGGSDEVQSSVSYKLGKYLESLQLTGAGHINGTGNELANTLIGNDGNNSLDGGKGLDSYRGGKGDDSYLIDDLAETDITELAVEGTDSVLLKLNKQLGSYTLPEHLENLMLTGTAQVDLIGNLQDNFIVGNAKNNSLSGLGGNDSLDGGKGADTLIGGSGDDTYFVDNAADVATEYGGEGNDILISNSKSYQLGEGVDIEILRIGKGSGKLTANSLDNTLIGNGSANSLDGGAGDDIINGGKGNDKLTGGLGADRFVFETALKNNVDSISDFEAGIDQLQLNRSLVFGNAILLADADGQLNAENFRSGASLANIKAEQDADDLLLFDTHAGALYYDADGSGASAPVKFVILTGVADLSSADIVLV